MDYGIEYYEGMLRQYSKTAEEICKKRWDWIMSTLDVKTVLDYGSGVGWFRAWRPPGVEVHSYDVGPMPQTGLGLQMYDVTCFWDVLEHIPDFSEVEPVLALSRCVVCSLPIVQSKGSAELGEWKHFKPGEHVHYFTRATLKALFSKYGFDLLKAGQPECPPRVDIWSFIFTKRR